MSKLKNASRRKTGKHTHKTEGARVKAKASNSTKVEDKVETGRVKKCLGFIFDTFKTPAINWCIQNWPSICEAAGKLADVVLSTVS